MVWQHTWIVKEGQDSVGVFAGLLPEADIDNQISVTGSQARETGLLFSFTPRAGVPGGLSWLSISTVLSMTGLDLSKSEHLEFYAAEGDSLDLVIDLGVVAGGCGVHRRSGEARRGEGQRKPLGIRSPRS